jgi:SAM-dependent methyltransferase
MALVRRRRFVGAALALPACGGALAQLLEEVPFVVTPDHVTRAMLEIADVKPGDFVLDLGSGDGRIVIAAASRFGARGLGVELVPDLVQKSRDAARRAGVADRTEFRVQDLFATDLAQATVITMYLLPEVNLALKPKLRTLKPGTRIVSHDWDMGADWPPDRMRVIDVPDKRYGREMNSKVFLWIVR